jgi:hypothetical protein
MPNALMIAATPQPPLSAITTKSARNIRVILLIKVYRRPKMAPDPILTTISGLIFQNVTAAHCTSEEQLFSVVNNY